MKTTKQHYFLAYIFWLMAFSLFLCEKAYPQYPYCPTGNISLFSQADVNNFAIDYPDCTEFSYSINILDDNNDITDLSPLSNLTSVGRLSIRAFSTPISLYGLHNITTVEGDLVVHFNSGLTSLAGLENIVSVGGYLRITENPQLTSLSGLDGLTYVGEHTIISNNGLISFSGLENLEHIGNSFGFTFENALTSISALENLTHIGTGSGSILIENNNSLTSLLGLESLQSVGEGGVGLLSNNTLTDISALQNIDPSTIITGTYNGLRIINNPLLSVCNLPNFCTYLQNGGNGASFSGIYGNMGDCISESAVLNACALSVSDNQYSQIKMYPNPVTSLLYFDKEVRKVTITDLAGKVLVVQSHTVQIDMSAFQNGAYLITIEIENNIKEIKKVIKN